MIIEIPEAPFPKTIGDNIQSEDGITSEIWGKWLAFAMTDFVLMHIWARMEYVRVMRVAFGHGEGDNEWRVLGRTLFTHLVEGTLAPDMLTYDMAKGLDNGLSWWNNSVDSASVVASNILDSEERLDDFKNSVGSKEDLFYYFVGMPWNTHVVSGLSEQGRSESEPDYRAMLRPTWDKKP